jgi:hypothetical protein
MYEFGGKRDLGEVVHVMHRKPTGPARGKPENSAQNTHTSVSGTSVSQILLLSYTPVALLEESWRIFSPYGGMPKPRQTLMHGRSEGLPLLASVFRLLSDLGGFDSWLLLLSLQTPLAGASFNLLSFVVPST